MGTCSSVRTCRDATGAGPHLQVTVGITTLLGLDEEPGELSGYGPITADLAREIAGDATWTRILTDPTSGTLLDYGRTVYRPPQSLADRLIATHRRCRGIGCRMPARRCHLDHTRPFPDGPTAESNLGPLCEFDHIGKHETDWRCEQR
ncbi:MAG: HNH endonuclease, partial [Spirochaetaceae bacterium]|nr:HNH endonuclease [Spirochaetaceae bacterium]